MKKSIQILTKNTPTIAESEATNALLEKVENAFKNSGYSKKWSKCREYFAAAKGDSSVPTSLKFSQGVTCVNTASGWMHAVISAPKDKPFPGGITRVSYQFAPPIDR